MNNKENPLVLWLLLSFFVDPLLYFRNGITNGNFNFGGLVISSVMGLGVVLVAAVVWFIIKMIYKLVAPEKIIGNKAVLIIWGVIFAILFLLPLFRK
jgi:hypothetical protein